MGPLSKSKKAGLLAATGAGIRAAAYFMPWVVAHGVRTVTLNGARVGAPVLSIVYSIVALVIAIVFLAGKHDMSPRVLAGFGVSAVIASIINFFLLMNGLDEARSYLAAQGEAITVSPGIGPWVQLLGAVTLATGGFLAVRWTNLEHAAGVGSFLRTPIGTARPPTGTGGVSTPPRPDVFTAPTQPKRKPAMTPSGRLVVAAGVAGALLVAAVVVPGALGSHVGTPSTASAAGVAPTTTPTAGSPLAPSASIPAIPPGTPSGPPPAAHPSGPNAVAYQIDIAHDGDAADAGVGSPLTRAWTRRWPDGTVVSYPIIAGDTVFVSVAETISSQYATRLYAFDTGTGDVRWKGALTVGSPFLEMAYDRGRLFTVDSSGRVTALDARTGATAWSARMPNQYSFTSPPTAWYGELFVGGAGSGGTLYAVDERTGAVRWIAGVENGDHSSPVLMGNTVAVGYACYQIRSFLTATGTLQWNHSTGCDGGGGRTMAYHDGRLYARDDASAGGRIIDANTGRDVGRFASSLIPAFDGNVGYFQEDGTLRARDLSSMKSLWSFAGDGALVSAPLVVDGHVFVASSKGTLFEVGGGGRLVGSYRLGAPAVAPDEHNGWTLTGLNAGDGVLAVSASERLVVFP